MPPVKFQAQVRVEAVEARICETLRQRLPGATKEELLEEARRTPPPIVLSSYRDEVAFSFLMAGSDWSFDEFRAVNGEVIRLLRERGWRVEVVTIETKDYFDWLAAGSEGNTSANRAAYADAVASGTRMPTANAWQ